MRDYETVSKIDSQNSAVAEVWDADVGVESLGEQKTLRHGWRDEKLRKFQRSRPEEILTRFRRAGLLVERRRLQLSRPSWRRSYCSFHTFRILIARCCMSLTPYERLEATTISQYFAVLCNLQINFPGTLLLFSALKYRYLIYPPGPCAKNSGT